MFLSIVIPVYKDAEGIKNTIKTLLDNNQEMTGFEIIVCIDGGLKEDVAAIEEMIEYYPGKDIRYNCIVPNQGSYNARNIGAKNAKGDVLSFLDAGVFVQKEWYAVLEKYILQYDYIVGSVTIPLEWAHDLFERYESVTAFPVEEYINNFHFGPTANMIVKKSVFENVKGFDGRLRSSGDLEFGDKVYRNNYTQVFSKEMEVLHSPRNRKEIRTKMARINQGHIDLHMYYPDRFGQSTGNPLRVFIKNIIKTFLYPSKFKTKQSEKFSWLEFIYIENVIGYYRFIIQKNV